MTSPPTDRAAAAAAALKGATLAFQQQQHAANATRITAEHPRTSTKPLHNGGALLAATQASREHDGRMSSQSTGSSIAGGGKAERENELEHGIVAKKRAQFLGSLSTANQNQHLVPLVKLSPADGKNASFIAATLAASKTGSPRPSRIPGLSAAQARPRVFRRRGSSEEDSVRSSPSPGIGVSARSKRREAGPRKIMHRKQTANSRSDTTSSRSASPNERVVTRATGPASRVKPEPKPKPASMPVFNHPKLKTSFEPVDSLDQETPRMPYTRATRRAKIFSEPDARQQTRKPTVKSKLRRIADQGSPMSFQDSVLKDLGLPSAKKLSLPPIPQTNRQSPPKPMTQSTSQNSAQPRPFEPEQTAEFERLSATTLTRTAQIPVLRSKGKDSQPTSLSVARSERPPRTGDAPRSPIPAVRRADFGVISPQPNRLQCNPRLLPPSPSVNRGKAPVRQDTPRAISRNRNISPEPKTTGSPIRQPPQEIGVNRSDSSLSSSSADTFVSASSNPSPQLSSPPRNKQAAHGSLKVPRTSCTPLVPKIGYFYSHSPSYQDSCHSPDRRPAPLTSTSSLPFDSLTNAIVASNLASSRHYPSLSTRNSSAPPPPTPRRHDHRHYLNALRASHTGGDSSPPRAPGTMLQTLRAPRSLSDDEDARAKHNRRRKAHSGVTLITMGIAGGNKKHAHHEASRRRWRDEISAAERRRYEAVWASNRGMFLRPGWGFHGAQDDLGRATELPESELVVNVVVRDLWRRSRLPADELAEVWELVDRKRYDGALDKSEFVVGLWLIDQRLRGRKLPARVSESVWASAEARVVVHLTKKKGKRG